MEYIATFAKLDDGDYYRVSLSEDARTCVSENLRNTIRLYLRLERCDYSDYKPEKDEILRINEFRDFPEELQRMAEYPMNTNIYDANNMSNNGIDSFCFVYKDKNQYCFAFQKHRRENITLRNGIHLVLRKDTFVIDGALRVCITNDIDCLYTQKCLLFKKEYYAKQLFDLKDYYRIATEEDVNTFIGLKNVAFDNENAFRSIANDSMIRRKIALLNDKKFFVDWSPKQISEKTQEILGESFTKILGQDGILSNDTIRFPNDKKRIKTMLKLFSDEIYRGTFDNIIHATNSNKPL